MLVVDAMIASLRHDCERLNPNGLTCATFGLCSLVAKRKQKNCGQNLVESMLLQLIRRKQNKKFLHIQCITDRFSVIVL